jgi:dihydroflavonol-4-reductase
MIFVTGGTGLLGAQLLLDITKSGKKVRALKRASSNLDVPNLVFSENRDLLSNIEWVNGDVTDFFSVKEALQDVKEIYHCAGKISFQPSEYKMMMNINATGTANMVNAAMECGVEKFCHVSSVAAMGREKENELIDEKSFWKTSKYNSNYAISKYAAEREVWRAMEEGLNAVIVNPTIIIGPADWKNGSAQMFAQVRKGLKFYTEGISGFVDVRDVSRCMISLMEKNISGERFIITTENLSYREVFNTIADCLSKPRATIHANKFLSELGWRAEWLRSVLSGHNPLVTKETARNSQLHWFYSNEKIKKELAVDFIPIKNSIQRTAEYFLKDFSK